MLSIASPRSSTALALTAIFLALAGCATAQSDPAGSNSLTITYEITGAVHEKAELSQTGGAGFQCSAIGLPALHATVGGQAVEAPPGPPVYAVDYDPGAPSSRPAVSLRAFAVHPGVLTHSDPADDYIQINAGHRKWTGHGGDFTDSFTLAPDGRSGHLVAHGLRVLGDDKAGRIDLDLSWRCPSGGV